jgi:hypothetical protein
MGSSSKVPRFEGDDYAYWKVCMHAYLQSLGAGIWDICTSTTYIVLAVHTTPLEIAQHDANSKAVNALFTSLSHAEFDCVSDLTIAREIWSHLQNFHEGTNDVKTRLVEVYKREYENFMQLPGEGIDAMFSHFQSIMNKVRANKSDGVLPYTDHERALKLLYALDPKVWESNMFSIIESSGYATPTTYEFFSKLKATEIHLQSRAIKNGPTSPSLALASASSRIEANANSYVSFALSTLVSAAEVLFDFVADNELCFLSNKF